MLYIVSILHSLLILICWLRIEYLRQSRVNFSKGLCSCCGWHCQFKQQRFLCLYMLLWNETCFVCNDKRIYSLCILLCVIRCMFLEKLAWTTVAYAMVVLKRVACMYLLNLHNDVTAHACYLLCVLDMYRYEQRDVLGL